MAREGEVKGIPLREGAGSASGHYYGRMPARRSAPVPGPEPAQLLGGFGRLLRLRQARSGGAGKLPRRDRGLFRHCSAIVEGFFGVNGGGIEAVPGAPAVMRFDGADTP
jgi:hypothetical protein